MIQQELDYLIGGTGALVTTINGQNGTAGNMDIISTTPAVITITTVAGLLTFVNHGICTINSVSPNSGTGNVAFVAGPGTTIDTVGMPPNTWRISSTVVPVPPNYQEMIGVMGPDVSLPTIDQSDPDRNWVTVGCGFPPYNGGTCGWTAPDNGAYVVQVIATFTVQRLGSQHNSMHMSMGVYIGPQTNAGIHPSGAIPEVNGVITALDSAHFGDYRSPSTMVDVSLSATVVVQGAGQNVAGCLDGFGFPTCGYGVSVYFKGTNGDISFMNDLRVSVGIITYRWTRAT